ncbi:Catabolite control protein A [Rathayibacter tanaceti]|uniref:Catabolite control protein A n=1 Tax=Rathayibacter tanaceti TaxID=1671680 RepID=A0A166HPL4_9MICO|nr:Catabolite control protein A [Rathayibacter tanaceti]
MLESRPPSLAYVDGRAEAPDAADRRAGFRAALHESGGEAPAVREECGDFTRASGRAAVERLLAAGLPDAIVCANDQMALGVLDGLAEAGIDVPARVQVTGFDGIEAGRLARPRLTTVHQPMHELGRIAVSTLVERLADPSRPARSLILPVEVLLRESTL